MTTGDKFLDLLIEQTNKWTKKKYTAEVEGRDITSSARYLSMMLFDKAGWTSTIKNGREDTNAGTWDSERRLIMRALWGRARQGYGEANIAIPSISQSRKTTRWMMDQRRDELLLRARRQYHRNLGETFVTDDKIMNNFTFLSADPVEEPYIENRPRRPNIPEDLKECLKAWTREMYGYAMIRDAEAKIWATLNSKRFVDSQGRIIKQHTIEKRLYVGATFSHKNGSLQRWGKVLHLNDWGATKRGLDNILKTGFEEIRRKHYARIPISDAYPGILSGQSTFIALHEILTGHNLSGQRMKAGTNTAFLGKLGRRVMPEYITIVDDPTAPGAGHYVFDDEGIRGQRVILVENGILKTYLFDRDSAGYFRKKSNGHARREGIGQEYVSGFDTYPLQPRNSNVFVLSDNQTPDEELVDRMKFYCKKNGDEFGIVHNVSEGYTISDPNDDTLSSQKVFYEPATARFILLPDLSWAVYPDGHTEDLTNYVITDSPFDMLRRIRATGTKMVTSFGICGDDSGYVAHQGSAPAILIPKITINQVRPGFFRRNL